MGYDSERRAFLFTPPCLSRAGHKRKTCQNQVPLLSSSSTTPAPSSTSRQLITIRYPSTSESTNDSRATAAINETPSTSTIQPANNKQKPSTPKIIKKINRTNKCKIILAIMKETKNVINKAKEMRKPFYLELLKTDQKCSFYTNIPQLKLFDTLHDIVKPFVRNRFHRKNVTKKSKVKYATPKKCGRQRVLDSKDELLLTMMKLRLSLFFEDLGDRFGISKSTASKIFQCWIRALSVSLNSIIYLPADEEKIWNSTPQRFRKFLRLNGIIDCTEVFIETPKSLELQRATWSEYKHHNTIKFLISVLPNSAISFISEPYTGGISDKAIVNCTKFLETLPAHCSLMTDKGFSNISQECSELSIHLIVPPGRRGTSQMTPEEVKRTSEIAKTRILVEQVIRRVKTFQILAKEVPISLLRNLHDIMVVCCAVSNFREPIMK